LGLDAIKNLPGSVIVSVIGLYTHYTDTSSLKPNPRAVKTVTLRPMQTLSLMFTHEKG